MALLSNCENRGRLAYCFAKKEVAAVVTSRPISKMGDGQEGLFVHNPESKIWLDQIIVYVRAMKRMELHRILLEYRRRFRHRPVAVDRQRVCPRAGTPELF